MTLQLRYDLTLSVEKVMYDRPNDYSHNYTHQTAQTFDNRLMVKGLTVCIDFGGSEEGFATSMIIAQPFQL